MAGIYPLLLLASQLACPDRNAMAGREMNKRTLPAFHSLAVRMTGSSECAGCRASARELPPCRAWGVCAKKGEGRQ